MSETKYEVLARMDAAILFFEDSARNLREIKQQWLEAHEEQRDEPPTEMLLPQRISPLQKHIMDTISHMAYSSLGGHPTLPEVVETVWLRYPRGQSERDQRKDNARRDIRHLIQMGKLVQEDNGELLPRGTGIR